MVTLRDVARLARVSTTTVSSVVNRKGRVSQKLATRVREAVERLDYHPHQGARSLKTSQSHTIGMLIGDATNPFFIEVMRGAEDEARRSGYSLIFCNVNGDAELELHYLNTLFARRVDGVLLAPVSAHALSVCLARRRFPLVLFDRIPQDLQCSAVITDNLRASREAVRHLVKLGHRRIAIITGRLELTNAQERLEGFRQALEEAHLPLRDEYLRRGDFRTHSGYQHGLDLMRLPEPPTAIFCCNNLMTLGLMRALGELHIICPKRVSILGFDDFDWAASFSPRLTTIAQPTYEMGRMAMELLSRKIQETKQGKESKEQVVVLENELRIRESTAPPNCATTAQSSK